MNCARFEQLILRQEPLPSSGNEHQRRCARCQEFADRFQAMDRELEGFLPPPSLPPGFDQRLAARLAQSAVQSSHQLSLRELIEEDERQWERFSGKTRQELRHVGLNALATVTLITSAALSISARFRDSLPNAPMTELIPFTPLQIAVFLGCAALCAFSAIWSTLQFRRQG